jgi:hypothetical protein
MNRPKRPGVPQRRKKPTGPPRTDFTPGGPPRRRSPLDVVPQNVEPRFRVLGTGVDRASLAAAATPLEMIVIHGYTREVEEAYQKFNGRLDDFWARNPQLLEPARKLDDVLAAIAERKR